jgi:hypothetical protein
MADIHYFEGPALVGHRYPCSLEDVRLSLEVLPKKDLEGLAQIGLVAAERKDGWANGRYEVTPRPRILLFSVPEDLSYELKLSVGQLKLHQRDALEFGMRCESAGRWTQCSWDHHALRAFFLYHVLLHEVGHHVYRYHMRHSYEDVPINAHSERFADDYARRIRRELKKP